MSAYAVCDERRKITQEVHEAWAAAWLSTDKEFRAAWLALLGGTEEDAARAEELFPKVNVKHAERLRQAIKMKFSHEARTGHKIPLPWKSI
jgi:hypothetical protein